MGEETCHTRANASDFSGVTLDLLECNEQDQACLAALMNEDENKFTKDNFVKIHY